MAWIQALFTAYCLVLLGSAYGKKNVLFLVSDDMRPNINAYLGPDFPAPVHPKMHTPNLDKLASQSLLLKRGYVQQALCNPSRTSLLTGRRPDSTHVYDNTHYFREVGGNFTTIPGYFKQHGYKTIGMGKIFHHGSASGYDDPVSWTEPYFHGKNFDWHFPPNSWHPVDAQTCKEKPLIDTQIAQHAIKTIKTLADNPNEPFFLAVGFHKPHLPWIFPEEFLNYYPEDSIKVPDNQYAPVNMPSIAWYNFQFLRDFKDVKALHASGAINTTFPPEAVRTLRRAYYSALSYTDSLVGEVIKALEDSGMAKDTIISFFGDHGWQLGEHGEWCKHTDFELATHAPMMVHIPGLTDRGIVTEELTEFVDLFPTLAEAAELQPLSLCPQNATKVALCTEGASLMPLIQNKASDKWKDKVFSQYMRGNLKRKTYMGYTMRTADFRYTEWVEFVGAPHYKPIWDKNIGTELYDHRIDPEENYNHAWGAKYKEIKQQLSQQLRAGWRQALPKQQQQQNMYFNIETNDADDVMIL